jgi:hypothetical protein
MISQASELLEQAWRAADQATELTVADYLELARTTALVSMAEDLRVLSRTVEQMNQRSMGNGHTVAG